MSWYSMIHRCKYKYRYYQDVSVCERWLTFENFLEDMGARPDGHTLDRIDPKGNYEPGNCRWATIKEQNRNRKQSINLTINGVTRHLLEWAEETGVNPGTVYNRLANGRSPEEAIANEGLKKRKRKQKPMTKQQSPAERVIAAFGGNTATAQALGCNRSTVFRWTLDMDKGGTGGRIPSTRQYAILAKARELGIRLYPIDLVDQRDVVLDDAGHAILVAVV